MSKSQITKRNHYVPRFHLRNFVNDDEILWVFDKDSGASRPQKPWNTVSFRQA